MNNDSALWYTSRGRSKPLPEEFSLANERGITKIVVGFEDSPATIRWQFVKGTWQVVTRWRA